MSDFFFTLPIYGVIKKTKNNKNLAITFNWGRCAHFRTYSKAKKDFKSMISNQLNSIDKIEGKLIISYTYFAKRNGTDMDNFVSVSKKFFQDALVESGLIGDDNTNYIIESREKFGGIDKESPRIEARINISNDKN